LMRGLLRPRCVLVAVLVLVLLGSFIYVSASSTSVSISSVFEVEVEDAVSAVYVGRSGELFVLLGNGSLLIYSGGGGVFSVNLSGPSMSGVPLAYAGITDLGDVVAVSLGSSVYTFPRGGVLDGFDVGGSYVVAGVAEVEDGYALIVIDSAAYPPFDTYLVLVSRDGYVESVTYLGQSIPSGVLPRGGVGFGDVDKSCLTLLVAGGIRYVCMGRGPYISRDIPGITTGDFFREGLIAGTFDGRIIAVNSTGFREVAYLGGNIIKVMDTGEGFVVAVNNEGKVAVLDEGLNVVFCGRIAERVRSASVDSSGRFLTIIEPTGLPIVKGGRLIFRTKVTVFRVEGSGENSDEGLKAAGISLPLLTLPLLAASYSSNVGEERRGRRRYLAAALLLLLLIGSLAYVLTMPWGGPGGSKPSTSTTPTTIPTHTPEEVHLSDVNLTLELNGRELADEFLTYLAEDEVFALQEWVLTLKNHNQSVLFPISGVGRVLKDAGLATKVHQPLMGSCVFEVEAPQQINFTGTLYINLGNCNVTYGEADPQTLRNFLIRLRSLLQTYQGVLDEERYCYSNSIFSEVLETVSNASGLNLSMRYLSYEEYLRTYREFLPKLTKLLHEGGEVWVNITLTDNYAEGRFRRINLAVGIPEALIRIYNETVPARYPLITPKDPVIMHMVNALKTLIWSDPYPYKGWRLASLLTQIPQQLTYVEEVPSWPLLTLVKGGGLCAARTYLGITLLEAAGIPSGEIVRKGTPNHSYLAVSVELPPWVNGGEYLTQVKISGGNELNTSRRYHPVELVVEGENRLIGEWGLYESTEPYVIIYPYTKPDPMHVWETLQHMG